MTVYVDPAVHPFGRMVMCHMFADTEVELLAMADRIGVARKWVQRPPKASWLHFDIAKGKRSLAVAAGAVEVDRYECAIFAARQNGHPPERIAQLEERITRCRAQAIPAVQEQHA